MKVVVYLDTREGVKKSENEGIESTDLYDKYLILKGGDDSERVYMADKLLDYIVHPDNEQK